VNTISPALVTQRGARRLPRLALLLLSAAYVLPGIVGRDPWRNADLVAYAQMLTMAQGRNSWWAPSLGGLPLPDVALFPHWLGAVFVMLLSPGLDPVVAARIPFVLLLSATLALTWYATFHLARTDHAQPLPLAFGGEADPIDYARAIADGALLATIATLGLLQLGHETTPELMQLASVALFVYGLAAAPFRSWQPRAAVVMALVLLAGSGAPSMGLVLGLAGALICHRSAYDQVRHFARWVWAAIVAGVLIATWFGAWRWRGMALDGTGAVSLLRQWLWFLWPTWPFVLWTLWRWRGHLLHRHISVPLALVLTALAANVLMGGSDRALLLAVPGAAVLCAFALPTFRRSTSAAIDWFSLFFFSVWALTIWVLYVAVHTGVPSKPAANVAKLAPGFVASFELGPFALALIATLAWLWLLRWRTGRHRDALWKSLVLPAGGVTLCFLLLMMLGLQALDYARSMRTWIDRVTPILVNESCVWTPDASAVTLAALTIGTTAAPQAAPHGPGSCRVMLVVSRSGQAPAPPAGWTRVAEVRRPTDRGELTVISRRDESR
jgi:hypothetical protein